MQVRHMQDSESIECGWEIRETEAEPAYADVQRVALPPLSYSSAVQKRMQGRAHGV